MCYLCPELNTVNVVDQRVNINLLYHRKVYFDFGF